MGPSRTRWAMVSSGFVFNLHSLLGGMGGEGARSTHCAWHGIYKQQYSEPLAVAQSPRKHLHCAQQVPPAPSHRSRSAFCCRYDNRCFSRCAASCASCSSGRAMGRGGVQLQLLSICGHAQVR